LLRLAAALGRRPAGLPANVRPHRPSVIPAAVEVRLLVVFRPKVSHAKEGERDEKERNPQKEEEED